MHLLAISLGVFGIITGIKFSTRIDGATLRAGKASWRWLKAVFTKKPDPLPELYLVSRLQSSIRGGMPLDRALDELIKDESLPLYSRNSVRAVLEDRPGKDFLSIFLASALRLGTPILDSLGLVHRILVIKRRMKLKAISATSQSRAQAEVLAALPWFLFAALFLIDYEWAHSAVINSPSWILWAFAIFLTGVGRTWINHQLKTALTANDLKEKMEEEYIPELILRLISLISMGMDPQTALETSLIAMEKPVLNAIFAQRNAQSNSAPHQVLYLKSILLQSAKNGTPLRSELVHLLEDIQSQQESRWEERVQRLPVLCLAPLFCCFFPASLLVLIGLILPILAAL